jgi:YfiH family protein
MKDIQYREHQHGSARYLTFPEWEKYGELRHLFTTRWGGVSTGPCENWNLGFGTGSDQDTPEHREHNVAVLADCLGTTPDHMVWTQQTHTTNIRNVTEKDAGRGTVRPRGYTDIDGLVTDRRNVALITTHADCNPLFFYDPVRHVIGLAHSGWKGTLAGIGRVMIGKMRDDYGSDPADILCGIGPALCGDCFEVDKAVADQFLSADPRFGAFTYRKDRIGLVAVPESGTAPAALASVASPTASGGSAPMRLGVLPKYFVDLWKVNRLLFEDAGVLPEHIFCMGLCTKENTNIFFSHRGQNGRRGLMAAAMMLV